MRVLHVVTLVSPSGAFGGPLRVALNQAEELARRGHDVRLAAGWDGEGPQPSTVEGVPATLFRARQLVPGLGFSGLLAPAMVPFLRRESPKYDIVHIHAGRDLISVLAMAVVRASRTPYVVQTHGMIAPDTRPQARLMDAVAVRRLVRSASLQLVLTEREQAELPRVLQGPANARRVLNGVPLPAQRTPPAHDLPEVLYCARIHDRKRPAAFVAMAAELRGRGIEACYAMVGPDEGALAGVRAKVAELGLGDVLRYEGSLSYGAVLDRVSQSDVYVLPSVDEPFPMSLLEAMSLGVPSVCTDSFGISDLLAEQGSALVTDGSPEQLADAVQKMLQDPDGRQAQGRRGREAIASTFAISAVVDRLEGLYDDISSGRSARL